MILLCLGMLLIESFLYDGRHHVCVYGFVGCNGQQMLGLLLIKCMEELGFNLLGFVATDYVTLIWGLDLLMDVVLLFDCTALCAGLESWL